MTRPLFGLLLVIAALLQTALLPRWQLLAVTPSLVVVLLLAGEVSGRELRYFAHVLNPAALLHAIRSDFRRYP